MSRRRRGRKPTQQSNRQGRDNGPIIDEPKTPDSVIVISSDDNGEEEEDGPSPPKRRRTEDRPWAGPIIEEVSSGSDSGEDDNADGPSSHKRLCEFGAGGQRSGMLKSVVF